MADGARLYPLTQAILEAFPTTFVQVDEHDPNDPEHPDFLWLELSPDSDLSIGERLEISPLTPDVTDLWYASFEDVPSFGTSTTTGWSCSGTPADVIAKVSACLDSSK